MIIAYRVFSTLIYPFLFFFILFRLVFKKEDIERYKEKVLVSHFNVIRKKNSKLILFHAASLGEFKSIIPIVEKLNSQHENIEFLITTTTLSSSKIADKIFGKHNNVHHRFFPFDVDFLIKSFLNLWKPDRIFLVDSEIWPNLILTAKKNKIPIALLNARITTKSYNRWSRFQSTAEEIFGTFDLCLCSNNETKEFLRRFKAKNIEFKGNIKLIEKIDSLQINNINKEILSHCQFWVAASIHDKEDIPCLKVHLNLKKKFKQIITIIIPRHIERVEKIKKLSENFGLQTQILKDGEKISENKEIVIVNSYGVLQNYYKYSKSVFIGKSLNVKFKLDGGQNPIEAAKLNCRIYHGPYVSNFSEIYKILQLNKVAKKIETFEELSSNLIIDLETPKKDDYISSAMDKLEKNISIDTMKLINNFLI